VGGKETGFFRYPKAGEKVLVCDGEVANTYYLMGYLPSVTEADNNLLTNLGPQSDKSETTEFNNEKQALKDEEGMVLRYKQTGKKDSVIKESTPNQERYSEIGFYHKPTSWKPSSNDKGNYTVDSNGKSYDYPRIDQINIQSTGDIHTTAKNHHRTKAKRFELFVDCDPPKTAEDYESNQPFGDRNGDDSFLYAGDAHIRAKNRIVIKAGESIELQAGRSSIIIDDEGITIASRKTQSNIYNAWDTVIALTASRGIDMFGQHVGIRGGIDYKLSEGYGGSISSRLGVMRLAGVDIRAETMNSFNYLVRGELTGLDFLMNAGTMSAGAAGAGFGMGKHTKYLATSPLTNFLASKGSSEAVGSADPSGTLFGLLDILFTLSMVVEIALGMAIPKVHKRDKHGRDGLYTALALAEYGLIIACFVELYIPFTTGFNFESSLHLTGRAEVLIDGRIKKDTVINTVEAKSPLAGVSLKSFTEAYKDGWMSFIKKTLKTLVDKKAMVVAIIAIGIVAAGGIGVGMGLSMNQDKELEEELRSL
jgi:hypothetical protein